jgi:AcrR family transcriptional regulator
MSNNPIDPVRKSVKPDPRVVRSTSALGGALIALIQERDLADITVQDILDRAGVGRATFYAHYRNKEDVLHSSFEHLFAAFDGWLDSSPPRGNRVFPVAEFLDHIGGERKLSESLRRSGQLEEFWSLCSAYAARCIEARLPAGAGTGPSRQLFSRMLAGALMESIMWWLERPDNATPAQMDAAFHGLARGMLSRMSTSVIGSR